MLSGTDKNYNPEAPVYINLFLISIRSRSILFLLGTMTSQPLCSSFHHSFRHSILTFPFARAAPLFFYLGVKSCHVTRNACHFLTLSSRGKELMKERRDPLVLYRGPMTAIPLERNRAIITTITDVRGHTKTSSRSAHPLDPDYKRHREDHPVGFLFFTKPYRDFVRVI